MQRSDDDVNRPPAPAHDLRWTGDLRDAVRCAGVLLTLLLLVDWGAGRLAPWRCALWLGLSLLLFVVLCPARVSAGDNWLASRGLLRERRVRTDLLVSVRWLDGVSQRLVLRDALGSWVEIDPQVLGHNPELWFRLAEGARRSTDAGTLESGSLALSRLSRRIDRETARAVFRNSGLE